MLSKSFTKFVLEGLLSDSHTLSTVSRHPSATHGIQHYVPVLDVQAACQHLTQPLRLLDSVPRPMQWRDGDLDVLSSSHGFPAAV